MPIGFPITFFQTTGAVIASTYTYVPCVGGPVGLGDIYVSTSEAPGSIIIVATGNPDEAWCYITDGIAGLDPATEGITWGNDYSAEEECPEFCQVYEINTCFEPVSTIYTTNSNVMSATVGAFTIIGSEDCWQTIGVVDLSNPNSVLEITDVVFDQIYTPSGEEGCACCDDGITPNRWEYELCPEYSGVPAPLLLVVEVPNPTGATIRPDTILYDYLGITYCYSNPQTTCQPVDGVWTEWLGEPGCEPCILEHPGGGGTDKWIYESCTGCEDIVSTDPLHEEEIPTIWVDCCFYEVPESTTSTEEEDTGWTIEQVGQIDESCEDAVLNMISLEWEKCEGMEGSEFIYTSLECCTESSTSLYLGITANDFDDQAISTCYTLMGPSSELPEVDCIGLTIQECGIEACEVEPVWELVSCDGAYAEYITESDFNPDPSSLNENDVINVTSGSLASSSNCWQIYEKDSGAAPTLSGTQDWNGPIQVSPDGWYDECECCAVDLREYVVCDGAPGSTCNAAVNPILVIDMTSFGGTPPDYIIATDDASGFSCCYVIVEEIPECQQPTGSYVSAVEDCEDPSCNLI
jgi:hypothetical protein